jgi:hypothetical protein
MVPPLAAARADCTIAVLKADSTGVLEVELNAFRNALNTEKHLRTDLQTSLSLLDSCSEQCLESFFAHLNEDHSKEGQSKLDRTRVRRILEQFTRMKKYNLSAQATQTSLDQLFGVLHCTFIVGYTTCMNERDVAWILETVGGATLEVHDRELEAIEFGFAKGWNLFAQYAAEVVRICRRIIQLR